MTSKVEVSCQLAAFYLLGNNTYTCSDIFNFLYVPSAVRCLKALQEGTPIYTLPTDIHNENELENENVLLDNSNGTLKMSYQYLDYAYRGAELSCLSLYEYVSLISIDTKITNNSCKTSSRGRPRNQSFDFHVLHPFYDSKLQKIRSKFTTPILTATPPTLNSSESKIAEFYLSVFFPWSIETIPNFDYGRFQHILSSYQTSNCLIKKSIYYTVKRLLAPSKSNTTNDNLLRQFRYQDSQIWTDCRTESNTRTDLQTSDDDIDNVLPLITAINPEDKKTDEYLTNQLNSLLTIFSSISETNRLPEIVYFTITKEVDLNLINAIIDYEIISTSNGYAKFAVPEPNREQKMILNDLFNTSTNLNVLIHGPPGSGKTFLAKHISNFFNGRAFFCAPTGCAASLLPCGRTIHNLFQLSPYNLTSELSNESLLRLRSRFSNTDAIIIDEISMLTALQLFMINLRLQEINGNSLPFGGLHIILLGDFLQLPPTHGLPLYKNTSCCQTQHELTGIMLYQQFSVYNLSSLERCKDTNLAKIIIDFRNTYRFPLKLFSMIGKLNKDEVIKDQTWWQATHIVASNKERLRINFFFLNCYAARNNLTIYKWRLCKEGLQDNHSVYQYFVIGAPIALTDNINPILGLANGSEASLHSFILDGKIINYTNSSGYKTLLIDMPSSVIIFNKNKPNEYSLCNSTCLLPIGLSRRDITIMDNCKKSVKAFPYDLGFCYTFYKAQGKTLPKVILHLDKRPGKSLSHVTLQGLYVSLTRIRYLKDIAYLGSDVKYLFQQNIDATLQQYLNDNMTSSAVKRKRK